MEAELLVMPQSAVPRGDDLPRQGSHGQRLGGLRDQDGCAPTILGGDGRADHVRERPASQLPTDRGTALPLHIVVRRHEDRRRAERRHGTGLAGVEGGRSSVERGRRYRGPAHSGSVCARAG